MRILFLLSVTISVLASADPLVGRIPPPTAYQDAAQYLLLEFPDDRTLHFEFAKGTAPANPGKITTSVMVFKKEFKGPTKLDRNKEKNTIETAALKVSVDPANLCFTVEDKIQKRKLTALCTEDIKNEWKSLKVDPGNVKNVLGLGQSFVDRGQVTANGDWYNEVFEPMDQGNGMKGVFEGAPSHAQFPMMYAVGDDGENYGLFLDVTHKIKFDLKQNWWRISMLGNQIRGFVISGTNVADIHRQYVELTGLPPVPPKQTLGLWTSEFGYTSWGEIESILESYRDNKFPAEGFMLDIQWFNLSFNAPPEQSRMGSLTFNPKDKDHFPDADKKIANFRERGIRFGLIQEPYLSEHIDTKVFDAGKNDHQYMSDLGYLAKESKTGKATRIVANPPWWGTGGLIDFTHPVGSDLWFDKKTKPLLDKGVLINWTDLTEPEMYDPKSWYYNDQVHKDVHNIFALSMAASIHRGYERNKIAQRPYTMSRSGTCGMQRYAAAMWSGDVAANMKSLAGHYNARMHMAMLGMNYYSSDVGGFHPRYDGDPNKLYTQWFANAALLDIPIRPHGWSYEKLKDKPAKHRETAPTRVGHLESNRENLRLRYKLAPYYYSLSHVASRTGAPVMPPLVYYFQQDAKVRSLGDQVMVGPSLMTAIVAGYDQTTRPVYFPKSSGKWFDFYTNLPYDLNGDKYDDFPIYRNGLFTLPLFARAGAIVPMALVDEKTENLLGQRSDKSRADEFIVRVYADAKETHFDLFEDDGETIDYLKGKLRTTRTSQKLEGDTALVKIAKSTGDYGAPKRNHTVELVVDGQKAKDVRFNGTKLTVRASIDELNKQGNGYVNLGANIIVAKSGEADTTVDKTFEFDLVGNRVTKTSVYFICENGKTEPGENIYVTGNIPELGLWDAKSGIKLDPQPYPTWTRFAVELPANKNIEWKCARQKKSGEFELSAGGNNAFNTAAPGYFGKAVGKL